MTDSCQIGHESQLPGTRSCTRGPLVSQGLHAQLLATAKRVAITTLWCAAAVSALLHW